MYPGNDAETRIERSTADGPLGYGEHTGAVNLPAEPRKVAQVGKKRGRRRIELLIELRGRGT